VATVRVEVWCRPMAVVPGVVSRHELVASWDDPESTTAVAAAERAWTATNAHPETLSGWMREARRVWDPAARGRSLGVGDVVVVGGTRLRCVATGFVSA
jgi:hypothetical protein